MDGKQRTKLVARRRPAEEIALETIAAGSLGQGEFLLRLDALGDDGDVLDACDLGERRNENLRHLVMGEAADSDFVVEFVKPYEPASAAGKSPALSNSMFRSALGGSSCQGPRIP